MECRRVLFRSDFLASLKQQKRKKLKQDSKKVRQAGVQFRWLQGRDIDDEALGFFYRCYTQSYLEHGNAPYLNHEFFLSLRASMAENMVIVLAAQDGEPVASALNLRSNRTLYGRYWGSMRSEEHTSEHRSLMRTSYAV